MPQVGDKDLYVKAGSFTSRQPLVGSTYRIVTAYKADSLRPGRPKMGFSFYVLNRTKVVVFFPRITLHKYN